MDSLIIKQEKTSDEAMEIALDIQTSKNQELTGLEAFPAEINKVESRGEHYLVSERNSMELGSAQPSSITVLSRPQAVSSTPTSQIRMVNLTNSSQGSDQSAAGNNQILVCSSTKAQPLRTAGGSDGQNMITKFIIAPKTATSGQQQVLSVGPHGLQPVVNTSTNSFSGLIGQPGVASSLGSPTKTYTISQGGVLSPQKLVTASNVAKLPISPAKNPSGMTMISFAKSPPGKQQYVMLTKSGAATVPTSRPMSYSLSPSKVIIKGQPTVSVANVSQATQPYIVSQAANIPRVNTTNLSNVPSNVQPLSVSGSKFQYVRLVTTPTTHSQSTTVLRPPAIAPAPQRSLATVSTNPAPIKLTMPLSSNQNMQIIQQQQQQQQQHKQTTSNPPQQRVILPATSQVIHGGSIGGSTIRASAPSGSSTTISNSSNIGQAINLQGLQGFALIPAQYLTQPQVQTAQAPIPTPVIKQETFHTPQTNNNNTNKPAANSVNGSSTLSEPPGQRPRKPCNCTKSQCLKLYCDCFANGEFCSNCNCNNCFNNLEHEEERQRAIKTCLERNPHAFHPKIGKGRGGNHDRRHNKGCNCKRSGCLKNYCECYEAKILCSNLCKCVGCKNFEESPDRKTLMHLADAAEVRHQQQTAAKTKLSSQIQDLPVRPQPPTTGERLPYTFVTPEVAEATCACLVAQAEEAERTRQQEMMEERMILQEFGRCLMQVIQSATKTKAPSPVP